MGTLGIFSKKRIKSHENKIYSLLIIANIFGIILDVFSSFISKSYLINTFDYVLLTKIIMVYFLTWLYLFLLYVLIISHGEKKFLSIYKHKLIIIYVVLSLIQFSLPLTHIKGNGYIYPRVC